ncbi:MAG: hypothetical protein P4L65_06800 [Legionella sp.]|nr:hypothetical protein [Legionella sp.]
MLSTQTSDNITHDDNSMLTEDELHAQANQYISEANHLIFQSLPKVISQIIAKNVWKKRAASYANFGEYALTPAPDGLGITNNEMLWLLKSTMNTTSQHAAQWGDVLGVVDTNVRSYAKEKKIPIKDLSGDLAEQDNAYPELFEENMITYLPSRSKSVDGQIMKLKKKDPEAYDNVVQGKMKLKEAWPQTSRKRMQPIESVKNKFSSLSKSEREEFLAWIEQERENLA